MDLSSQPAATITELSTIFEARMKSYDAKLQSATGSAVKPALAALAQDFGEFKSFVWNTLTSLKSQIELLSLGLDRHEAIMRGKVLLLHGVPETKDENIYKVVVQTLEQKLKMSDLSTSDFVACHRLGAARKHFGLERCWSVDGKIIVRLPDKTRQKIELASELKALIAKYPNQPATSATSQGSAQVSASSVKSRTTRKK
ncbi:hypothetical protein ACJJTC_004447 [Scirpophaga incertulas]